MAWRAIFLDPQLFPLTIALLHTFFEIREHGDSSQIHDCYGIAAKSHTVQSPTPINRLQWRSSILNWEDKGKLTNPQLWDEVALRG